MLGAFLPTLNSYIKLISQLVAVLSFKYPRPVVIIVEHSHNVCMSNPIPSHIPLYIILHFELQPSAPDPGIDKHVTTYLTKNVDIFTVELRT